MPLSPQSKAQPWQAEVVTAQGRAVPAAETPWMRSREMLVHAVDLGTGLAFADLPDAFLAALRADIADVVAGVLAQPSLTGRWGVGLARRGLPGASESLGDARLALRCTSSRHPLRTFADDWHEAIVLAERARFGVLLAAAVEVADAHPHLAEAVLAFAGADMSIADTARAVHVHANSVTYRLDRWSRLTGLEARSFAGLTRSVTACRLAELGSEDGDGAVRPLVPD